VEIGKIRFAAFEIFWSFHATDDLFYRFSLVLFHLDFLLASFFSQTNNTQNRRPRQTKPPASGPISAFHQLHRRYDYF